MVSLAVLASGQLSRIVEHVIHRQADYCAPRLSPTRWGELLCALLCLASVEGKLGAMQYAFMRVWHTSDLKGAYRRQGERGG